MPSELRTHLLVNDDTSHWIHQSNKVVNGLENFCQSSVVHLRVGNQDCYQQHHDTAVSRETSNPW